MVTKAFWPLMGYQVLSCDKGVYHLKTEQGAEFIALLHTAAPLENVDSVNLFMEEVPKPELATRMQAHWGNLDARRLAESGLQAVKIWKKSLGRAQGTNQVERQTSGTRHIVIFENEVQVCLN